MKNIRCVRELHVSHLKIMVKQGKQDRVEPDTKGTTVRSHGQRRGRRESEQPEHTLFFFLIFFIFYSLWGLKENGVLVTRKFSGFFVEVFVAVVGWLVFK